MAYFYVKSGGSATGDAGRATSQRTGTFAAMGGSAYYATLTAAMAATTTPTSGDFILVSDQSSAAASAVGATGPSSGDALYVISVDDTACDTPKAATSANEGSTGSDTYLGGHWYIEGVYLVTGDDMGPGLTANSAWNIEGCTLDATGTGDNVIFATGDGQMVRVMNSTLTGHTAAQMNITAGSTVELLSCTITGLTDYITNGGFINGGGTLRIDSSDLSSITGTLIANVGNDATNDDNFEVYITNCKTNASLTGFTNETFVHTGQRVVVAGCGSDAGAEYQFCTIAAGGRVDEDTGFYRDSSTAFTSGQRISLKCVTDSLASYGMPFLFDYPSRFVDLSDSASNVLSVFILSSSTLTNKDIWVTLLYADGTNLHVRNQLSSRHANVFTSGTTLSTNSETWTGRTTENRYQIDLDTSGDAGAGCVVAMRVHVAKPSATIYICPTLGLG